MTGGTRLVAESKNFRPLNLLLGWWYMPQMLHPCLLPVGTFHGRRQERQELIKIPKTAIAWRQTRGEGGHPRFPMDRETLLQYQGTTTV